MAGCICLDEVAKVEVLTPVVNQFVWGPGFGNENNDDGPRIQSPNPIQATHWLVQSALHLRAQSQKGLPHGPARAHLHAPRA